MTQWRPLASREHLLKRAGLLRQAREFFYQRDVVEVQTPLLGQGTVTDPDVESLAVPSVGYLQTSPEYFIKRLLAAGMPSCYQLAGAFRAGEQGRLHNPEFTMLEWYRLDFDHQQLMAEVAQLVDALLGPGDYATRSYASLVADVNAPREQLDLEFATACAQTTGRVFIVDYPASQAALARLNPADTDTSARFELVIDGVEIANGYWELLDVAEHRARFKRDAAVRQARGLAARPVDEAFLAAIEHGLPACAGVALGFDRLVMRALGVDDIESVLAFRY